MFGKLFEVAKNIVTLPVAVTIDAVNIVTLGAIDGEREESYTETNLKRLGRNSKEVIDDILED